MELSLIDQMKVAGEFPQVIDVPCRVYAIALREMADSEIDRRAQDVARRLKRLRNELRGSAA